MRRLGSGGRGLWLLAAMAAAAAALVVVLATGGEDRTAPDAGEGVDPIAPAQSPPQEREESPALPEVGDEDPAEEPAPLDERSLTPAQREVARTARAYIEGLDARDGQGVCDLLAPGAIEAVELPRRRGGCAPSLRASIGHRDPRGSPVWQSVAVRGFLTVALDGERASVTVTTVTRFADRDLPSIEDDVVHLRRHGDRWLIVKPSATLHRAVGIADVPPRVLAPPE